MEDNLDDIFVYLWKNFLNSPSPENSSELWNEHKIIYEQMSIAIKKQKPFIRPGLINFIYKIFFNILNKFLFYF